MPMYYRSQGRECSVCNGAERGHVCWRRGMLVILIRAKSVEQGGRLKNTCEPRRSFYLFIYFLFLFFVFLPFLGPFPGAYGGSKARGRIGAVAAGLCQGHSNSGFEAHLQPTPQLTATPDP